MPKFSALLALLCVSAFSQAADVTLRGLKPGAYTLEVSAAGEVTLTPTKVIVAGTTPPNPTDPNPPPGPVLTPFEKVIVGYTKAAMTNEGASKTTGAALSEVYSRVSVLVASGAIKPDQALPAVFAATNLVMGEVPDKTAWTGWRTDVGRGLETLKQDGELSTPAQYASALKQVSNGLNSATGYTNASQKAVADGGPDQGILDGIDIDKIIKLIELIMKLLALFGGLPG